MSALSELINNAQDKGKFFEQVCLHFLKHDKLCKAQFSEVWLWRDFPYKTHGQDTGIDIVARLKDSEPEKFCAVQCKAHSPGNPINKADIDSFLALSSKEIYAQRILISLHGELSSHAQDAIENQSPKVTHLTLADLEGSIDWSTFPEKVSYIQKTLHQHQTAAIDAVMSGFEHSNRGKLIMACGTGKTLTSLRIAEHFKGNILVLVPSISLLNQSITAWHTDAITPLKSFAVCSDLTVGYPEEDANISELCIPATTDADTLLKAYHPDTEALTVIFSTYQSLQVIHDAQAMGLPEFTLTICDEAHRTAGLTSDKKESIFRKIHDEEFIRSQRRLYMTATPKIFTPNLKAKAESENILLCSMDNEEIYGPEFYTLTFSEAVKRDLLTDYKIMIFMIDQKDKNEPDIEAITRGVRKALAKDISPIDGEFLENDTAPMHRAVAFSSTIKASREFTGQFRAKHDGNAQNSGDDDINAPDTCNALQFTTKHIDGTMSAQIRKNSIQWLKDSHDENICRILSNARCLCEGVDVPALDAIIFLSPKSSEIDIVQSVGRVMRKVHGKKYGYVILPVIISPDETPEYALDHNESYRTIWKVLQALRSIDDEFNIEINSLDFNGKSKKVGVSSGTHDRDAWFNDDIAEKYRHEIYIRMVKKCGDREYWPTWVKALVDSFKAIKERITEIITDKTLRAEFDGFTEELRAAINKSITPEQAVEMLSQHITSKEVFDAIFSGFADNNPVSQSMQKIRTKLESHGADLDPKGLDKFNKHIRDKARSARTGTAKQKLLRNIYENFFTQAFPDTAKTLGIVYTPEEIVDFIIRSADWAVRDLLGIPKGLAAKDVHILDPFSGTGTFTARLIGSGIIPEDELSRKYDTDTPEIHANEILLLAYYISAINIEAAYIQAMQGYGYREFPGMVFADTFKLNTDRTPYLHEIFHENGERATLQEQAPINVIIGNPPYNVGKKGGVYQALDGLITSSYAQRSRATNKNSLYDSYIRAIKWASEKIHDKGIICYVSNGSFIDSNSADGMRKCLAQDFTGIYIFNLRGNQRGGDWRKEGAKIFGGGSMCPIAITLFVKDGRHRRCEIRCYEVGDYLTREEKLADLAGKVSFGEMMRAGSMTLIEPNRFGDWVNHRSGEFEEFLRLGNKHETDRPAIFEERYSRGVVTGHDAYSYNFSREALRENIKKLYPESYSDEAVRVSLYSPYVKEYMHFSHPTIQRVYQMPYIFPEDKENRVICVSGIGSKKNFSVLMTDCLPSLTVISSCQCFPLYSYHDKERYDGISDDALKKFREHYSDDGITKEDIFSYIYGVLSSREYALRFGSDTTKMLARVPYAQGRQKFWAFCRAGRELGRLHVGYQEVPAWPLELDGDAGDLRVKRMRIVSESGERVIRYSDRLTVRGIPSCAWDYCVNGRSALEWIVERYRDDVDAKSNIRNDCNAWGEAGYVLELIGRVVSVSVETVKILGDMPELGV